jgi:hypothetical protein
MHIQEFGSFSVQFGLIRGSCETVSQDFLDWQMTFLPDYGMRVAATPIGGTISDALRELLPRTAPIAVRYLFWPLNEEWTLYFDNGKLGTDASPPALLASRLHTDGIRISLVDHMVDRGSKKVLQYGATIFEYFEKNRMRRSIFAANNGEKWIFGQEGTAFSFEDENAYQAGLVRERFSRSMLLRYLHELNASLDGVSESSFDHGPGKLVLKSGQMPRDLREFHE